MLRIVCSGLLVVLAARAFAALEHGDSAREWDACEAAAAARLQTGFCVPRPPGGWQWLMSVRDQELGWREETHRAVIALAVAGWRDFASPGDIRQMELQLEVELTRALLRNATSPTDLALYVHALLATQKNPRDFHGVDLVAKLQAIVDSSRSDAHPFLLLALCNAGALQRHHAAVAGYVLQRNRHGRRQLENRALALQAYACAASLPDLAANRTLLLQAQGEVAQLQSDDGSFGNLYTTALVVSALSAAPDRAPWNRRKALDWLRRHATDDVNVLSTHLVELALHAERVPFVGRLGGRTSPDPPSSSDERGRYYVQYTVRGNSSAYLTVTMKVPPGATCYDVMRWSAEHDPKFNFSEYSDAEGRPHVFSISGLANSAEENLYWRLCLQDEVDHTRHSATMSTVRRSPATLIPRQDQHVIFWYKDSDCEAH